VRGFARLAPVAQTSLAGGIASRRFSGNGADGGGIGDDKYVKYLALRLSEGRENEAAALVDWLRCRATTAVDRHWRQIEAVASALLEKEELSGAEITQLLQKNNDATRRNPNLRK
jgi:hypothetical protein